jgi:hypothetical protein
LALSLLQVDEPVVPLLNNLVGLGRGLIQVEELPELGILLELVHCGYTQWSSLIFLQDFDIFGRIVEV